MVFFTLGAVAHDRRQFGDLFALFADKFMHRLPGNVPPPRQLGKTDVRIAQFGVEKLQRGRVQRHHEPDDLQQVGAAVMLLGPFAVRLFRAGFSASNSFSNVKSPPAGGCMDNSGGSAASRQWLPSLHFGHSARRPKFLP